MRYLALACDYDGTLATGGRADPQALQRLREVRASGRKLILVTGRELEDLRRVLPEIDLFDLVVAENGGLLYTPTSRDVRLLCDPIPGDLVSRLMAKGVSPLSTGHVLIATRQPWETDVLRAIREAGLELQVIFNKGAVMILPSGVNKATGLDAALDALGISRHNTVGIGDAENDQAFLAACECSVAVAEALPMVKSQADVVLTVDNGAAVAELCQQLLEDDLRAWDPQLVRRQFTLGLTRERTVLRMPVWGVNVLVLGASGSGKSSLVNGLVQQAMSQGYQCCIVDPEGDYQGGAGLVVLGEPKAAPTPEQVEQLLLQPKQSAAVNLLGVPYADRPALFGRLMASLQAVRARSGGPHWVVADEAHHLLPADGQAGPVPLENTILVTVDPDTVAPASLRAVDIILCAGPEAEDGLRAFAQLTGTAIPPLRSAPADDEAVFWSRADGMLRFFRPEAAKPTGRRRHRRKYAEGDLGPRGSFYFYGPHHLLQLPAQNLITFLQLAEGVDEATWLYHLRRHDYSQWFRTVIKDAHLAEEVERIESDGSLSAKDSLARVKAVIEQDYTLPAVHAGRRRAADPALTRF